jgi:hypothetical protein
VAAQRTPQESGLTFRERAPALAGPKGVNRLDPPADDAWPAQVANGPRPSVAALDRLPVNEIGPWVAGGDGFAARQAWKPTVNPVAGPPDAWWAAAVANADRPQLGARPALADNAIAGFLEPAEPSSRPGGF